MSETNGKDGYCHHILRTSSGPKSIHTYAHHIPNVVEEDNIAEPAELEVHQQTANFIYLGYEESPEFFASNIDQTYHTPSQTLPSVVPEVQTSHGHPDLPQAPSSISQSYVTKLHPPNYNELHTYVEDNAPRIYQPQPLDQQFQSSDQSDVVITAQPKPTTSDKVFENSLPQRSCTKPLAITSLVMAIIGSFCGLPLAMFCTIPGIIFAVKSLGNASASEPEKARRHAKISSMCTAIGWSCGILVVVVWVILYFLIAGGYFEEFLKAP